MTTYYNIYIHKDIVYSCIYNIMLLGLCIIKSLS